MDNAPQTLAEWLSTVTYDHAWMSLWACIFSAVTVAGLLRSTPKCECNHRD